MIALHRLLVEILVERPPSLAPSRSVWHQAHSEVPSGPVERQYELQESRIVWQADVQLVGRPDGSIGIIPGSVLQKVVHRFVRVQNNCSLIRDVEG